ncbi:MAG: RDD family protein [Candidatus Bathyarchaeota archaeon]|jgi:uncharacterized RDD family membrane protein YckC
MSTGFDNLMKDPKLQNHWIRRLVAFIIDSIIASIIVAIIGFIIWIPFMIAAAAVGAPWYLFNPLSFPFFMGIFSVLYFVILETYFGGAWGKRIMGLKTVDRYGKPPTLEASLIRNISKIYWILILLDTIVGLAMTGDPRRKATDRAAGTIVVSTKAPMKKYEDTKSETQEPTAKSCFDCGEKLPPNAKHCPQCGKEQP